MTALMAAALAMTAACGGSEPEPEPKTGAKPDTAKPDTAKPDTAQPDTAKPVSDKPEPVKKWVTAVDPKPLSGNVKKGLDWLVSHQLEDGGWSQGEESHHMGNSMDKVKDKPNVGDTCAAILALIRSGSTPSDGPYAENIRKGLEYLCGQIKGSDEKSLYVTSVRGTRLQSKLGTYIDTFLASMVLAEVKDRMPDKDGNKRILVALDKVMDKIERNQKVDGTFAGRGWANSLSSSMASKGMNRMAQSGVAVPDAVLSRAEQEAQKGFDGKSFDKSKSAGVELYGAAATLGKVQDSANTNEQKVEELEKQIADPATAPAQRAELEATIARFEANKEALQKTQKAVIDRLGDKRFMAGFGSNGGEEFLSYMNIAESLVVKGGENWEKWDKAITGNLNRIQNQDGSWTGHHCITGRTFCTSAALLVLMADRTPVPAEVASDEK
jgi:hypothetical protein